MLEKEWNDYLEKYEVLYKLCVEGMEKMVPNLMELYNKFSDEIYKPTEIYKFMTEVKEKIESELELEGENKRLFEYWQVCEDNILNDTILYAFIYGYSLATTLGKESEYVLKVLQKRLGHI